MFSLHDLLARRLEKRICDSGRAVLELLRQRRCGDAEALTIIAGCYYSLRQRMVQDGRVADVEAMEERFSETSFKTTQHLRDAGVIK